jgi:hypothetical protein
MKDYMSVGNTIYVRQGLLKHDTRMKDLEINKLKKANAELVKALRELALFTEVFCSDAAEKEAFKRAHKYRAIADANELK